MDQDNQPSIDINSADEDTLTQLQGVGPRLARRIIKARPFATIEDLTSVRGISARDVERLRPSLSISQTPEQLPEEGEEEVGLPEAAQEPDEGSPIEDQPEELEEIEAAGEPGETGEPEEIEVAIAKVVDAEIADEDQAAVLEETQVMAEQETVGIPEQIEEPEEVAADLESGEEQDEITVEAEEGPLPATLEPVEEPPVKKPTAQPAYLTRGGACSLVLIGGFITLILAVAVTLGILSGINQGQLNYALPSQIAALRAQTDTLSTQNQTLAEDIDGLRSRMDNLESLSGQVSEMQADLNSVQEEIASMKLQIASNQAAYDELVVQLEEMDAQIQVLTARGDRAESFLEGLKSLMEEIFPQVPQGEGTP